jgi:hypothetical protein
MHAGVTTLPLREPKSVEAIKSDLILTDSPGIFATDTVTTGIDRSWLDGDGAAVPIASRGDNNDICRIILTGSTGTAKGVAFSHWLTAARTAHLFEGPEMGLTSSPALLSRGATLFLLGPNPVVYKIQGMATSPYDVKGDIFARSGR